MHDAGPDYSFFVEAAIPDWFEGMVSAKEAARVKGKGWAGERYGVGSGCKGDTPGKREEAGKSSRSRPGSGAVWLQRSGPRMGERSGGWAGQWEGLDGSKKGPVQGPVRG